MAVDNAILDERLAMGFKGGPKFSTDKLMTVNGQERRFQNRAVAIHEYAYGFGNKLREDIDDLKAFFMDRRGDFKSWLLKDWGDFQITNEVIGTADGVTKNFPITKTYTAGFNPYVRSILHIKAGTMIVSVGGIVQVNTGSPSLYNINTTIGEVQFISAPSLGSVRIDSAEFYVPVRFDGDRFPISVNYPDDINVLSVDDLSALEVIP